MRDRKAGKQRLYDLDARGLRPVHAWTGGFERFWNESFDRLDEYARDLKQARQEEEAMSATGREAPAQSATVDREIVVSRVISAPRDLVFEAFTEVRHLPAGLPGVDLLNRDRAAGADRSAARRVPRRPERLRLQQWIFPQRFFRENLKLGEGGEEGRDNDILRETFERTGASVMGKRMFDAGEGPRSTSSTTASSTRWTWPARPPATGVRIAGGGATILEYVNAALIDEFTIALSPVLMGSGIRLFAGVDADRVALEPIRAEPTQRVTHLTYTVARRVSNY